MIGSGQKAHRCITTCVHSRFVIFFPGTLCHNGQYFSRGFPCPSFPDRPLVASNPQSALLSIVRLAASQLSPDDMMTVSLLKFIYLYVLTAFEIPCDMLGMFWDLCCFYYYFVMYISIIS